MSITRRLLKVIKIKLSNFKYKKKYINVYQEAYNDIYNIIIQDLEMLIKITNIVFQKVLLLNKKTEYGNIIFIIE